MKDDDDRSTNRQDKVMPFPMLGLPLYSFRVIEEDFGVVALEFFGQLLTGFLDEELPDNVRHKCKLRLMLILF